MLEGSTVGQKNPRLRPCCFVFLAIAPRENRKIITFVVYVCRRNEKKKKRIVGTPRFHLTFPGERCRLSTRWIIFSRNSGGKPARLRVTFRDLRGVSNRKREGDGSKVGRGGRTGKSVSLMEVNASRVEAPVKLNCRKTLFLFLARKHAPMSFVLPFSLAPSLSFILSLSLSLCLSLFLYIPILLSLYLGFRYLARAPPVRSPSRFSSSSIHPVSPSSVCAVDSCLHLFH